MMRLFALCMLISVSHSLAAQQPMFWKELGKLQTLSAGEIKSSRWSIGTETLDRDYADYNAYKSYLGPLGAKRTRLQGGWAKCEKIKGQYDFSWLDAIVDDAIAQGVQPWLQASYGNPIYEGGGEAALAGGIPTSEVALAAWDQWVAAFVKHFKNRVHEWEIWNEPDLSNKFTALAYAAFYERTATTVRKEQPSARLIALSLCCRLWSQYADTVLTYLKNKNELNLIDVVAFHGYKLRPEDTYKNFNELKKVVLEIKPGVTFWQGENGAPSVKKGESGGALADHDWTEWTQAKWNLRRMLGDMGNDIEVTNIFQISDMYYSSTDHIKGFNAKGLLKARPDKSIEKPKLSYTAYQNTASVFSGKIDRITNASFSTGDELSAYAYKKNGNVTGNLLTLWRSKTAPVEDNSETVSETVTVKQVFFRNPVYIDLISGTVYEIPPAQIKRSPDNSYTFSNIIIPDYPIVIADKQLIQLKHK